MVKVWNFYLKQSLTSLKKNFMYEYLMSDFPENTHTKQSTQKQTLNISRKQNFLLPEIKVGIMILKFIFEFHRFVSFLRWTSQT